MKYERWDAVFFVCSLLLPGAFEWMDVNDEWVWYGERGLIFKRTRKGSLFFINFPTTRSSSSAEAKNTGQKTME